METLRGYPNAGRSRQKTIFTKEIMENIREITGNERVLTVLRLKKRVISTVNIITCRYHKNCTPGRVVVIIIIIIVIAFAQPNVCTTDARLCEQKNGRASNETYR